jgi:predicted acylesterase/phospholipase RssA
LCTPRAAQSKSTKPQDALQVSDAVRASCALPGIVPPLRIGGRWLMDGTMVNRLPICAARASGRAR